MTIKIVNSTRAAAEEASALLARHVPVDVAIGRPLGRARADEDGPISLVTERADGETAMWHAFAAEAQRGQGWVDPDGHEWMEQTAWRDGVATSRTVFRLD